MTEVAERPDTFAAGFDAFRRDPAFGPDWLRRVRTAAFDRFQAAGLPTTRDEEWRFTSLAPIASTVFQRAPEAGPSPADVAPFLYREGVPTQVVVVNGRLAPALSTLDRVPAGVTIGSLREQWLSGTEPADGAREPGPGEPDAFATPFVDLNTAFVEDGVRIQIAPKTVVSDPIHVLFVTSAGGPVMVPARLVVVAGDQSEASIVETAAGLGDAATLTNAVTTIRVGAGAHVKHVKLQRESVHAFHLAGLHVRVARAGVFTSQAITLGGRIARNDIVLTLAGEGAEGTLNGVYVADGESLVDTHTTIDHAEPNCPSHEVYKGILAGRARAVFNGKIIVRPQAQKTDAKQTNKALLLSDDAQINTKPQLEIFADDVRCTHGAAIGQLDEDSMFYLRARGIAETDARNMLIHAFAGDVLDGIGLDVVRDHALELIDRKLRLV